MGHIFISYSHKDTKYAHALADHLKSHGFDFWIDERLDYGSQWPHELQKQLDSCDAFLLIMSPRSFASDWVQSELQRAKRKSKPIFPLLLEGDEPWLSVESTQYFDVRGETLPDGKFFSALQRVVIVDPRAATFNRLPQPVLKTEPAQPKKRMGWIAAGIGGAAIAICACAAMMSPLLGLISGEASPTLPPTQTATVATERPLQVNETATLIQTPTFTFTAAPTTVVPPTTETSIPTPRTTATLMPTATHTPQSVCDQYDTIPLQLYWSDERQDNITAASAESINGAMAANYRLVRTEGRVLRNPQPGTLALVLYYEGNTAFDNFTVSTSDGIAQAVAAGYWRVRDGVEGYIFTTQFPGTIPLKLYYHFERQDNFTTASNAGQAEAEAHNYQFIRTEGYVCP